MSYLCDISSSLTAVSTSDKELRSNLRTELADHLWTKARLNNKRESCGAICRA